MKFITLKNSKKNHIYSIKVEGDVCVIYDFDQAKKGFIRAIQINRDYLLRKLVNNKG